MTDGSGSDPRARVAAIRHGWKAKLRLARELGLPLTPSEARAQYRLQTARAANRPAPRTAPSRIQWRLAARQRVRAADAAEQRRDLIRSDLLRAARVARQLGYSVRASRDRDGRVSSYYVRESVSGRRQLRISDHDVPWTLEREERAVSTGRGFFEGSADIYASARPNRRPLWWRRAYRLAFDGRAVPGSRA